MGSDQRADVSGPDPAAPVERRSGFQGFWTHPATVVGTAGVMLLMVTTLAMLALRRDSGAAEQNVADGTSASPSTSAAPGSGGPLLPMTPVGPGGSASAGGVQGGGRGESDPNGPGGDERGGGTGAEPGPTTNTGSQPGAVFGRDTVALSVAGGENAVDLDVPETGVLAAEAESTPEIVLKKPSIRAKGGASYAVWPDSSVPTQAQCAKIPSGERVTTLDAAQVTPSLSLCLLTTEGRPGVVTFTEVSKAKNGKLASVQFTYTIWQA